MIWYHIYGRNYLRNIITKLVDVSEHSIIGWFILLLTQSFCGPRGERTMTVFFFFLSRVSTSRTVHIGSIMVWICIVVFITWIAYNDIYTDKTVCYTFFQNAAILNVPSNIIFHLCLHEQNSRLRSAWASAGTALVHPSWMYIQGLTHTSIVLVQSACTYLNLCSSHNVCWLLISYHFAQMNN